MAPQEGHAAFAVTAFVAFVGTADIVMRLGHLALLPRKLSEIIKPVPHDGQSN
jgi:hypothetical protein